jgi:hypothetical protein
MLIRRFSTMKMSINALDEYRNTPYIFHHLIYDL